MLLHRVMHMAEQFLEVGRHSLTNMTLPGHSTSLRGGINYFLYSSVLILMSLCLYESFELVLICRHLNVSERGIRYECRQLTIQHVLSAADLIFRNITNVHVSNTLTRAATPASPFFPPVPPLYHFYITSISPLYHLYITTAAPCATS